MGGDGKVKGCIRGCSRPPLAWHSIFMWDTRVRCRERDREREREREGCFCAFPNVKTLVCEREREKKKKHYFSILLERERQKRGEALTIQFMTILGSILCLLLWFCFTLGRGVNVFERLFFVRFFLYVLINESFKLVTIMEVVQNIVVKHFHTVQHLNVCQRNLCLESNIMLKCHDYAKYLNY